MMVTRCYLNDLKIHDVDDYLCPYAIRSINLGSGPEPRVSSETKPQGDGSINRTRYWGPRLIELVGYVSGQPEEIPDNMATLRAAFGLRTVHRLRFYPIGGPEDELVLDVIPASGFDSPTEGWQPLQRYAITLEAPDPRIYRVNEEAVSYTPNAGSGTTQGFPVPLDFKLFFSGTHTGGDATVLTAFNDGTFEVPGVFTIDGPVDLLRAIRNLTTDAQIGFNIIALSDTDEIVVDTAKKTVTLNGAPRPDLIDAANSSWFQLAPGENVIDLDGTGFYSTTRLAVRYREAVI